jgi:hypothetical protein
MGDFLHAARMGSAKRRESRSKKINKKRKLPIMMSSDFDGSEERRPIVTS